MIRLAVSSDINDLKQLDQHIDSRNIAEKINNNDYYLVVKDKQIIAYLRYNLFWDIHPFVNMLYVCEPFRGQGIGLELIDYWETKMKEMNYHYLLTSTQVNEYAQHFFRRLNYKDIGSFNFPGEWMETILLKDISKK